LPNNDIQVDSLKSFNFNLY